MLPEHLSQSHDAASRRLEIVAEHVRWIHHALLSGRPARVLDLGCGPGLYANRLAGLGHALTGIDFSPASIAYAQEQSGAASLECVYRQEDIRTADFGSGYDLVMLIFGEFNVFKPDDARLILRKACEALNPTGRLLLEVSTFASVWKTGHAPPSWYTAESGLFSERPHLCLMENFWDEAESAATERYFILEAETGEASRYASSTQAYSDDGYRALLEGCGFGEIAFYPSLRGGVDESQPDFFVIVARKTGG
jgi:SAM-dependent methyltransferase